MAGEGQPLVWITGAGGLIGDEILQQARHFPFQPRALRRTDLDLLDHRAAQALFAKEKPAAILHCAALSRNPACEANPTLARLINVEATRMLAEMAPAIPFLFFSTDLVFDGNKGGYTEDDSPNPLSTYAATKVEAECVVRQHPRHIILRISLTGGQSPTGDRGFNEEMKNAWRAGKTLNLFVDEFCCPMAAEVPARAAWELLLRNASGTFHLNGSEKLSRLEIGKLLADRHPELNPQILAGSRKDYKGPPRPADTSLNCEKIQGLLSFQLPGLSEWLRQHPNDPF